MTSFDVIKEVGGITYRQLNHWIELGLIEGQGPIGSGNPRVWTRDQLKRVRQIKKGLDRIDALLVEYNLKPYDYWKRTDAFMARRVS